MASGLRGLVVMVALAAPVVVSATVAVKLAPRQQAARADVVVTARVLDAQSQWNEDHSKIITLTRVAVQKVLKGTAPAELVVRQFGGTVGDLRSAIEGDARLVPHQDVVMFLRRGAGNVVYLVAMAQSVGVLKTAPDGTVWAHFDPHGLVYADVSNDGPTLLEGAKEERVAWTTLLLDIQAGVKGGAQ